MGVGVGVEVALVGSWPKMCGRNWFCGAEPGLPQIFGPAGWVVVDNAVVLMERASYGWFWEPMKLE